MLFETAEDKRPHQLTVKGDDFLKWTKDSRVHVYRMDVIANGVYKLFMIWLDGRKLRNIDGSIIDEEKGLKEIGLKMGLEMLKRWERAQACTVKSKSCFAKKLKQIKSFSDMTRTRKEHIEETEDIVA